MAKSLWESSPQLGPLSHLAPSSHTPTVFAWCTIRFNSTMAHFDPSNEASAGSALSWYRNPALPSMRNHMLAPRILVNAPLHSSSNNISLGAGHLDRPAQNFQYSTNSTLFAQSIPHYSFIMQFNTGSAYIARNETEQFLLNAGADPTAVITVTTPNGKNDDRVAPTSPMRAEAPAFQVNSQSASENVPGLTPGKNVTSASNINGKAKDTKSNIPGDDHAAAKIKTSGTPATSASVTQLKKLVGTQVAEEILGKWDPSNPNLKITMPVWTQPMYNRSDRVALNQVIEKMYQGRLYRKFDFGTKIMKIALKKGIEGRLPADRTKASDQPVKGTSPKQTTARAQPTNSRALPTSRVATGFKAMNSAWGDFLISEQGRLDSHTTRQTAIAKNEASMTRPSLKTRCTSRPARTRPLFPRPTRLRSPSSRLRSLTMLSGRPSPTCFLRISAFALLLHLLPFLVTRPTCPTPPTVSSMTLPALARPTSPPLSPLPSPTPPNGFPTAYSSSARSRRTSTAPPPTTPRLRAQTASAPAAHHTKSSSRPSCPSCNSTIPSKTLDSTVVHMSTANGIHCAMARDTQQLVV
ncbi:hypothetical protein KC325_g228 [Hortaea werneckii]|nr:hypothetical protein KC325_g228 [Hortaea werneckii]